MNMPTPQFLADNPRERSRGSLNDISVKFRSCLTLEDLGCVSFKLMKRVFNRVDTRVGRSGENRRKVRADGVTYQLFLRELARNICLQGTRMTEQQERTISRTRLHLTQDFFDKLAFHGVEIDRSGPQWRITVMTSAETAAVANGI